MAANGHRSVPHAADARVQAWGSTREACLAEAVLGMVECFAEVSGVRPTAVDRLLFEPGSDEDLLVELLDEIVLGLEVAGRVPVDVEVETADDGGLEVRAAVAPLTDVDVVGTTLKGVSRQGLRIGPDARGWSCTAIVDV
ncbi:archease [Streptomyces sp. NPDC056069]|uniref:archease n=1 Tax=Streptomyces sp. NPDC056069 TaxID=3345702 RepID=UPI0035D78762